MESPGRLRDQESPPARATSELASSASDGGQPGRLSGTQKRRRTRHPNALAGLAAPGRSHPDVESLDSYAKPTPGVQPEIWVTISPRGRGWEFHTRLSL